MPARRNPWSVSTEIWTEDEPFEKYFTWKDDNGVIEQDNKRHLGTSAQIVQKYYPNLAGSNEDGHLFVNYAGLNVVALKAIDLLHEKQEELNSRMDKIFSKLNK